MFVCVFVFVSVSRITAKSNRPISLKLGIGIGPTIGKNQLGLTFVGDLVPVTDSGSLFTSILISQQDRAS